VLAVLEVLKAWRVSLSDTGEVLAGVKFKHDLDGEQTTLVAPRSILSIRPIAATTSRASMPFELTEEVRSATISPSNTSLTTSLEAIVEALETLSGKIRFSGSVRIEKHRLVRVVLTPTAVGSQREAILTWEVVASC